MHKLIVHNVDLSHNRLMELAKLSDQAKPFYEWIEKIFKIETNSHKTLNEIIFDLSKDELKKCVRVCFYPPKDKSSTPFLFDGIGRVYDHPKAVFYFLAWIIRDAPQQRLAPLISKMKGQADYKKIDYIVDSLAELIFEYKNTVKTFDWVAIREIIIDRLEGSRRSIKGHHIESLIRIAILTSVQNFYAAHNNYGIYKNIKINDSQVKIGNHTFDICIDLIDKDEKVKKILIPIKTRETEGGGHAHIFTRDITAAINDIKSIHPEYILFVIIIANNWSENEITNIRNNIDKLMHFDVQPNAFTGMNDTDQIAVNKFISKILLNEK